MTHVPQQRSRRVASNMPSSPRFGTLFPHPRADPCADRQTGAPVRGGIGPGDCEGPVNRLGWYILVATMIVSLASCGDNESARDTNAAKGSTPQRLRPDGSIQLTDQDRAALGLIVTPATE